MAWEQASPCHETPRRSGRPRASTTAREPVYRGLVVDPVVGHPHVARRTDADIDLHLESPADVPGRWRDGIARPLSGLACFRAPHLLCAHLPGCRLLAQTRIAAILLAQTRIAAMPHPLEDSP